MIDNVFYMEVVVVIFDELYTILDMYDNDVTVKQLKECLLSIEPEKRLMIVDYGTLVWALRT